MSLLTSEFKRSHGQYFTVRNPFIHPQFAFWAHKAGLPGRPVIEPFAGANDIIRMLQDLNLCHDFTSYDIDPADPDVIQRDVIANYPDVRGVAVTNPPYLAKNSAKRRKLAFPVTMHTDLYLVCLDLMLKHHDFVAAIVPAALGTSGHFRDRLTHIIYLPFSDMFGDTEHPVCLALFEPIAMDTQVWSWVDKIGSETRLRSLIPTLAPKVAITFNDPDGPIGLMAVDSTSGPTIRFCHAAEIPREEIKVSSRARTRISIDGICNQDVDRLIGALNARLELFRSETHDISMTPFKGLRKDGKFRRRLDFRTVKYLVGDVMARGI